MERNPVELTFGERLQDLRKKHKLSQDQVAKLMGVDRSTIGSYENDEKYPRYDTLVKIANFFNVSYDYLFGLASVDANAQYNDVFATFGVNAFTYNELVEHTKKLDEDSRKILLRILLVLENGASVNVSRLLMSISPHQTPE